MPTTRSSVHRLSVPDRKKKERHRLAQQILDCGVVMVSCTRCQERGLLCVAHSDRSTRCSECVKDNITSPPCDVFGFSISDVDRLRREENRLLEAELSAQADLTRLDREAAAALTRAAEAREKVVRLQSQRSKVRATRQSRLDSGAARLAESALDDFIEGLDPSPNDPFSGPTGGAANAAYDPEGLAMLQAGIDWSAPSP